MQGQGENAGRHQMTDVAPEAGWGGTLARTGRRAVLSSTDPHYAGSAANSNDCCKL